MSDAPYRSIEFRSRAPGFWIRRYFPEQEAFVLAPVDQGSEFLALIDPAAPARGRIREVIMESLFGHRPGLKPVQLLVRLRPAHKGQGGENSRGGIEATITDAFQRPAVRETEARNILGDDGKVISRWTESLGDAVDHHGRIYLARRAVEFFARMDAEAYGKIRSRAAGSRGEAASALPNDFAAALSGQEQGLRRRYNPILPFELQMDGVATPARRANFAIQRAIIEGFADEAAGGTSCLVKAQEELLAKGALLGVPAARQSELLEKQSRETALGTASFIIAGLMALHGAEPASKDCDQLFSLQPDGSLAPRPGLHDEVLAEMAVHPIGQSLDECKRLAAYLEMAQSRLARYEVQASSLVSAEQAKAAAGGKVRRDTQPAASEPEGAAPGKGMDRMIGFAARAAVAADHAHKLVSQVETLPWI